MSIENTNLSQLSEAEFSHLDRRISARELHKYVWGLMAIFTAFALTYPIACWRVSQSEKFRPYQSHVKPMTASYTSISNK
jgi:hypothetical protein